jgi:hypothetical protein
MIDVLEQCQLLLKEAGIVASLVETAEVRALAFEGVTVLGFIVAYDDSAQLLNQWSADATALISGHQFGLRRALNKAWNTYAVFLASASATVIELVALSAIEEDLAGTRKIARAGICDAEALREALLSLLPIQISPRLEAVNMADEIKLRTTELSPRVVDAFLSEAQETSVALVLEEDP